MVARYDTVRARQFPGLLYVLCNRSDADLGLALRCGRSQCVLVRVRGNIKPRRHPYLELDRLRCQRTPRPGAFVDGPVFGIVVCIRPVVSIGYSLGKHVLARPFSEVTRLACLPYLAVDVGQDLDLGTVADDPVGLPGRKRHRKRPEAYIVGDLLVLHLLRIRVLAHPFERETIALDESAVKRTARISDRRQIVTYRGPLIHPPPRMRISHRQCIDAKPRPRNLDVVVCVVFRTSPDL